MSIKNQKTLFICAFAIIGSTALGLIALNYMVEKISKINPPVFAMAPSKRPPMNGAVDDAVAAPPKKRKRPNEGRPPDMQQFRAINQNALPPRMAPPKGASRRARNGQEPTDIERSMTPPGENGSKQGPGYAPMYQPQQQYMSPEEQRRMQEEMDQRNDYYQESPPYYPPDYENDYYEDGYYPDYEYDYGYEHGPEGNLEDFNKDQKMSKSHPDPNDLENGYYEPDREMIDDYLNELYGE